MGKVKPKYIIGHWTAGNNIPNSIDMNSYDLLVTGDGILIKGLKEFDSDKCSTAGMNSITYNISCAGGDIEAPMTKLQMEKFYFECARILKAYRLDETKFYTHAEIGEMVKNGTITKLLPNNKWLNQNIGKIDLTRLPYDLKGKSHGDFIRSKIKWYLANM